MTPSELLRGVHRLFLDTAPVIYFVEDNPTYRGRVQPVFEFLDDGDLAVVTSPITLLECLVHPYRLQQWETVAQFRELLVNSDNVMFVLTDHFIADTLRSYERNTISRSLMQFRPPPHCLSTVRLF